MIGFETAAVIFVAIVSIIFVIIGAMMVVVMLKLKESLDKINKILEGAHHITEGLNTPVRAAATAAGAIMGLMEKAKQNQRRKNSP